MISTFTETDQFLVRSLEQDPAVLFLGQSYLRQGGRPDYVLNSIRQKYQIQTDSPSFNDILKIDEPSRDAVRQWISQLFDTVSMPADFEHVIEFPWSHIYTSAIDNNLVRAFRTGFRDIQPVLNDAYKILNPRNRAILHQTFLFGQIQYPDSSGASPLSVFELALRKSVANILLNRLPGDIVTPKGTLIIESWDPSYDWVSSSDLFPILSKFGTQKVHIFSANEHILTDPFIAELVSQKIIAPHTEQLSSWLANQRELGRLDLSRIQLDEEGTWIHFGTKRVKVPKQIKSSISKSAILLTRDIFQYSKAQSEETKEAAFKNFVSFSPTVPRWDGYAAGLAFKRDFTTELINKICNTKASITELPFIVHGQASAGKTIGLGQLVYELVVDDTLNFAVLFIERGYRRVDETGYKNIDDFCLWAEENGAQRTVIIYDGMLNYEIYDSLLSNLTARGRKVTVIGTTYVQPSNRANQRNFIEVPISLTENEKKLFEKYITEIITDKPSLATILKEKGGRNFLSILYHYLPSTQSNISLLLRREAKHYSDQVITASRLKPRQNENLILRDLLSQLGFSTDSEGTNPDNSLIIGGENEKVATHFINLVMVIGKQGLSVPFELLIRTIGLNSLYSDILSAIPSTDLIRWQEDHNGNISVAPRTRLEAMIYSNSLGGITTEVEFIKHILSEIRDSSSSVHDDGEIEFATHLIQNLKAKSSPYRRYIFEYAKILGQIRKLKQAVHPRLMLQEASLLQESIKPNYNLPNDVVRADLLDEAEEIVIQAISMEKYPKSPTLTFLKVELASILGSKAYHCKIEKDNLGAKNYYEEARTKIKSLSFSSRNYHALDVLLWTIRDEASITSDPIELAKLYVEALHFIQFGEEEEIEGSQQNEFISRKMEVYDAFGNIQMTDAMFDELKLRGSKAGYFLAAKALLKNTDIYKKTKFSFDDVQQINKARLYLSNNFLNIIDDAQCMYLLLKLWWLSKTGHSILFIERTALKFSADDWIYLEQISKVLTEISDSYISPTVKYLLGISKFHNEDIIGCFESFKELSEETDNSSIGSKRVKKYYVASSIEGRPKIYHGTLEQDLNHRNSSTSIFVEELSKKVKCFYRDFRRDLRTGQSIEFSIAFNFIGPVAVPIKHH